MSGPVYKGGGPDFSGEPVFTAGSVFGARHFKVLEDGTLTGVVFQRPWTAGTNVADCRVRLGYHIPGIGVSDRVVRRFIDDPEWVADESQSRFPPRIHVGWDWIIDGESGYLDDPAPLEAAHPDWYADDHDFAACRCGFYAYLAGSMDYADGKTVAGIVEGFGLVRQGTRGFRAQKVRIRALFVPDPEEGRPEYTPYDHRRPMPEALRNAGRRSRVDLYTRVKVSSKYPGVPMFTDLDEMLREFPTDPPKETP